MTDASSSAVRHGAVLVTGAGGFIGSHLAAELHRQGRHVVALDVDLAAVRHLEGPRFELLTGDVGDSALITRALRGISLVHHLAAAHLTLTASEDEFRRVNVETVTRLIHAACGAEVERFVHYSTVGVFGRIESPPVNEDAPAAPDNVYERTKLDGERAALEAGRATGVPTVVLRPAWVYGPGCPRTAKLLRAVRRRRFPLAGRGDGMRHCLYIRDLLEACRLAGQVERVPAGPIIIGDARPLRVRELLETIAAIVGAPAPHRVPLWGLRLAALASEGLFVPLGRQPPLSRRSLLFYTGNTAFEIDRARAQLGFVPRWDLADGMRETARVLASDPSWRVPLPVSPDTPPR